MEIGRHYQLELARIAFVEKRDGRKAAEEWARRVTRIYLAAMADKDRGIDDNGLVINHRGHYASREPWVSMLWESVQALQDYVNWGAI